MGTIYTGGGIFNTLDHTMSLPKNKVIYELLGIDLAAYVIGMVVGVIWFFGITIICASAFTSYPAGLALVIFVFGGSMFWIFSIMLLVLDYIGTNCRRCGFPIRFMYHWVTYPTLRQYRKKIASGHCPKCDGVL